MSDSDYDDSDDGECQHCGGEGRVAGTCIDGCCAEQDDPYCEYCSHRCWFCCPAPKKQTDDLRQVLADALSAATDASTKGDGK